MLETFDSQWPPTNRESILKLPYGPYRVTRAWTLLRIKLVSHDVHINIVNRDLDLVFKYEAALDTLWDFRNACVTGELRYSYGKLNGTKAFTANIDNGDYYEFSFKDGLQHNLDGPSGLRNGLPYVWYVDGIRLPHFELYGSPGQFHKTIRSASFRNEAILKYAVHNNWITEEQAKRIEMAIDGLG